MADLSLFLLTCAWGSTFLLVKNATATTSVFPFLAVRFGIAAAVLGAVWLWRRDRPTPGLWRDGLLLGLAMLAGFAFQTLGLVHTTPSRSAFITGMCVLVVPFLGRFLYQRAVPASSWVGVLLATAGLVALYRDAISAAVQWGDLLTAACALAYSFQIVWTGEFSRRHPLTLLTLVQVGVTFVGSALLIPLEPVRFGAGGPFWASILFMALAMTAGAFFVMNWAQRHTTAVRAALIYSLEPVTASLFSWYFGGEVMSANHLLGGALIVLGVLTGEVGGAVLGRLRPVSAP
ncbi:MAG: DMT family transporter [Deltaproteobacteria bacterium]|nr:DMT family transporter [Deltaproteobacteria bacterium]